MILLKITESSNPKKRYDAHFLIDGNKYKIVSFGSPNHENYLIHKDDKRRQRYIKRHMGMGEDWTNPITPGALSRYILWEYKTNIQDAFNKYKKRFQI